MSVVVTFGGNNYTMPEEDEIAWSSLTDYLVALSSAATTTSWKHSATVYTSSNTYTAQASDAIIGINYAGLCTVNIPAGTANIKGQIYAIYDLSGQAGQNVIVVDANGADLINGAGTYVIAENYGAVIIQWNGAAWVIISAYKPAVFKNMVDTDTLVVTFTGASKSYNFSISANNYGLNCSSSYNSDKISATSDVDGLFLGSDAGTGVFVSKSASSNAITIKNRLGLSGNFTVKSFTNDITGV